MKKILDCFVPRNDKGTGLLPYLKADLLQRTCHASRVTETRFLYFASFFEVAPLRRTDHASFQLKRQ